MYENCFIAMQNREDIYNALCIYYRNKGDDKYLVTAYIVLEEYNHEYFGYRGPDLRFDCPKININIFIFLIIDISPCPIRYFFQFIKYRIICRHRQNQ